MEIGSFEPVHSCYNRFYGLLITNLPQNTIKSCDTGAMVAQKGIRRKRKTVRLDGMRLRDERADRDQKGQKFTQPEMAELIGIGLTTYQKAEAGECVDEKVARRIA